MLFDPEAKSVWVVEHVHDDMPKITFYEKVIRVTAHSATVQRGTKFGVHQFRRCAGRYFFGDRAKLEVFLRNRAQELMERRARSLKDLEECLTAPNLVDHLKKLERAAIGL